MPIEEQLQSLPWPADAWPSNGFPFDNGLTYVGLLMDNAMAELRSGLALLPPMPELQPYVALRLAHHLLGDTPWAAMPETFPSSLFQPVNRQGLQKNPIGLL